MPESEPVRNHRFTLPQRHGRVPALQEQKDSIIYGIFGNAVDSQEPGKWIFLEKNPLSSRGSGLPQFRKCDSRPGPGWTAKPARQGFMSAQRRENRSQLTNRTAGAGASAPFAQTGRVDGSGGGRTAPPGNWARFQPSDKDPSLGSLVATKSLQSDHRFRRLPRIVRLDFRCGLGRASTRPPESFRSSPPPILLPSPSHPALPQIPAGRRRRAERYDGKRDLYFLDAA